MKNKIIILVFLICIGTSVSVSADILYLENGNQIEGKAKQTNEGVWIQGAFFSNNEIKTIERKKFKERNNLAWYDAILSSVGLKTFKEKKELKKLRERRSNNHAATREWANETRDKNKKKNAYKTAQNHKSNTNRRAENKKGYKPKYGELNVGNNNSSIGKLDLDKRMPNNNKCLPVKKGMVTIKTSSCGNTSKSSPKGFVDF